MRTNQQSQEIKSEQVERASFSYSSQLSYHEMEDVPVQETDILAQLNSNLETLKDMQMRMNFVMREIRYLMKV